MSRPNVPLITLSRGAHAVDLYDPRPHPERLGARFIQGGWVTAWRVDGREITGRCDEDWLAFDGIGLPETFETGLAWHLVEAGSEFGRIGAGRMPKTKDVTETHAIRHLSTVLDWEVESTATEAVFRTSDTIKPWKIGYRLERRVRLEDDGIVSTTTLSLTSEWPPLQPISWFAHPFFRQDRLDATAVELPAGAVLLPELDRFGRTQKPGAIRGSDGLWRMAVDNVRATFGGLWGGRSIGSVHLADGGRVGLELDRPLDHVVFYGNTQTFSIEPKWGRTWPHGESSTWSLRYRFTP